jgi:hypothetical protein
VAPLTRLPLEQLQPFGAQPAYDTSRVSFRRVTRDCCVSYAGNYYSVPAEYVRQTLKLKETESGQLLVFNAQDTLVAEHQLVAGHQQRIVMPAHYAGIGKSAKPATHGGARQVLALDRPDGLPAAPEVETRPLSWYDEWVEMA